MKPQPIPADPPSCCAYLDLTTRFQAIARVRHHARKLEWEWFMGKPDQKIIEAERDAGTVITTQMRGREYTLLLAKKRGKK